MLKQKRWCVVCVYTALGSNRVRYGGRVCAKCDPNVLPRIEHVVWAKLGERYIALYGEPIPTPSIADDQLLATDKARCATDHSRRPDLAWASAAQIVHLEIDERSHGSNPVACELAKLDETNHGVNGARRTTLFVRFNPDASVCGTPLDDRIDVLAKVLRRCCFSRDTAGATTPHLCALRANVMYLFYGKGGEKHQLAAAARPDTINVVLPSCIGTQ
jgi:hypothetical protein